MAVLLAGRRVVSVEGGEAAHWLQNLITCDVEKLAVGQARLGALLTPQGKILFDFLVLRVGETRFLLDVAAAKAEDLVKRLTFYRLRARIALAVEPLAVFIGEPVPAGAIAAPDPRHPALGTRFYAMPARGDSDEGWQATRVALGVPDGGQDFAFGEAFPHEALMDMLGGVDFRKGCYVGQEVVSRMEHRGTARTRLVPVDVAGSAEAGAAISAGERAIGTLGPPRGGKALAMIRLDRAAEALATGETLRAGEAVLRPHRPDFWTADWIG